jgi:hypothetical protein
VQLSAPFERNLGRRHAHVDEAKRGPQLLREIHEELGDLREAACAEGADIRRPAAPQQRCGYLPVTIRQGRPTATTRVWPL